MLAPILVLVVLKDHLHSKIEVTDLLPEDLTVEPIQTLN